MSGMDRREPDVSIADGRPWPGFGEALAVWWRIALLSFGGPAGQIAVMHRILVEEKRWLDEGRFLHALNFCMLLPGPEAQQLTVYVGWLMHRWVGGIVAGLLFVLPGAIAILALSWIYAFYGNVGIVAAAFFGLKAAVLAIVLHAVVRIGKRALRNGIMVGLAAAAFIAIFFFGAPFPAIILTAAVIGWVGGRVGSTAFQGGGHGSREGNASEDGGSLLGAGSQTDDEPGRSGSFALCGLLALLWLGPTAMLLWWLGPGNVFTDIAVFFTKMAVVTFGGAYAVLTYVAQAGVDTYGWLHAGEMIDGLGMAETTPWPLIMVTQFVGFMGAFRDPGTLSPLAAGVFGGVLTTWVTFTPCFLWIFLLAPYVERLRDNLALSAALGAITAAVVGVVLNLALWFGLHVVFGEVTVFEGWGLQVTIPHMDSVDPVSLALGAAALIAVFRFEVGMVRLLAGSAVVGVALHALQLTGG